MARSTESCHMSHVTRVMSHMNCLERESRKGFYVRKGERRKGGRKGEKEDGRNGGRERRRKGVRKGGREGGREGGRAHAFAGCVGVRESVCVRAYVCVCVCASEGVNLYVYSPSQHRSFRSTSAQYFET